jgi:hypothetical protein
MKPIVSGEATLETSPTIEAIPDAISWIQDVANSIWKAAKKAVQLVSARIISFKSSSRCLRMLAVCKNISCRECVLPCLEVFGYSFCCCSGGGGVGTLDEEELALKCIGEWWECPAGGGGSGAVDEQRDNLQVLDFLIIRQHFEMYKKSSFEKGKQCNGVCRESGHRLERLYIPSSVPCLEELLRLIIRIYRCKRGHFPTGLSALARTL